MLNIDHKVCQLDVVVDMLWFSYVEAKESMVYSYTKSFNAFAAKLSSDEANKLSRM